MQVIKKNEIIVQIRCVAIHFSSYGEELEWKEDIVIHIYIIFSSLKALSTFHIFQKAISNIKARLEGIMVGVGAAPSLPLSIEGQAQRLIEEAISLENLSKMYIWWMAWF